MSSSHISLPILTVGTNNCSALLEGGEVRVLSFKEAKSLLATNANPVLLHTTNTLEALDKNQEFYSHRAKRDLLELFLLIYPNETVSPTLSSLSKKLEITAHGISEAELALKVAQKLILKLKELLADPKSNFLHALLHLLHKAGWGWMADINQNIPDWASFKFSSPRRPDKDTGTYEVSYLAWLEIWDYFDKWEDENLRPQPGHQPVEFKSALNRLSELKNSNSEDRPTQEEFTLAASKSFTPREKVGNPTVIFAQGGTGIGKTLAYLAPASVWSEQNQGAVWLSTYTKHLQKQLWEEAKTLDKTKAKPTIVLKKGRENYLCILSLQEIVKPILTRETADYDLGKIVAALLLNWAKYTTDGDLFDGSLPGWFSELFPDFHLSNIADRSGECLYASCPFYRSCFVEVVNRKAKQADIVIANHALTILNTNQEASQITAGLAEDTDLSMPRHYVFDEGHLLFEACDNAFLIEFSIFAWLDIRRWILGSNQNKRRRMQGVRRRLEEIIILKPEISEYLTEFERLATRMYKQNSVASISAMETFFKALTIHLQSQTSENGDTFQKECDLYPIHKDLEKTIAPLVLDLQNLVISARRLDRELSFLSEDEEFKQQASPELINKAANMSLSLKNRVLDPVRVWLNILEDALAPEEDDEQINIVRQIIRPNHRGPSTKMDDIDIGIFRHFIDPMKPFAASIRPVAHGILETSATLFPPPQLNEEHQQGQINFSKGQLKKIGASHLSETPEFFSFQSPFNYNKQAKVFIVTDIPRDLTGLADAYKRLFEASDGGALGLFTAISRLKSVYKQIKSSLGKLGIPLLAQHIGSMGNASLTQIFREDEKSCLLGTDAMRDGLDIPGDSLHMIVLEKVPWARPDILHRARKAFFSTDNGKSYDEEYARSRIQQAFGRLIRRATDRGVFVILDNRTPSRLLNAFPQGVSIQKAPLAECINEIQEFLGANEEDDEIPF